LSENVDKEIQEDDVCETNPTQNIWIAVAIFIIPKFIENRENA